MQNGAKRVLCVLGVFLLIVAGHSYRMFFAKTPFVQQRPAYDDLWQTQPSDATPQDIRVRIDGCVVSPGVYRVPMGTTIGQLIEAYAGGPCPGADVLSLDLQQVLKDGSSVYVP